MTAFRMQHQECVQITKQRVANVMLIIWSRDSETIDAIPATFNFIAYSCLDCRRLVGIPWVDKRISNAQLNLFGPME